MVHTSEGGQRHRHHVWPPLHRYTFSSMLKRAAVISRRTSTESSNANNVLTLCDNYRKDSHGTERQRDPI